METVDFGDAKLALLLLTPASCSVRVRVMTDSSPTGGGDYLNKI